MRTTLGTHAKRKASARDACKARMGGQRLGRSTLGTPCRGHRHGRLALWRDNRSPRQTTLHVGRMGITALEGPDARALVDRRGTRPHGRTAHVTDSPFRRGADNPATIDRGGGGQGSAI
jgi:hypothetical protein